MNIQPKKRPSIKLRPRSDEEESTPVVKTTKRISFSAKTNVKEFRDGECGTEWNESYELSANCQTASDQGGDTQATVTMGDMTSHLTTNPIFNMPSAILSGPNKENINLMAPTGDGSVSMSELVTSNALELANDTCIAVDVEPVMKTPIQRRLKIPTESLDPRQMSLSATDIEMELSQIQNDDAADTRKTMIFNEQMHIEESITATTKRTTTHQPVTMELEQTTQPRRSSRLNEAQAPQNDGPKKVTVKLVDSKEMNKKTEPVAMQSKKRETTYDAQMDLDKSVASKTNGAAKVRATIYDTSIVMDDGPRQVDVEVVDYGKREIVHETSMVMSPIKITTPVTKNRDTIYETSMAIENNTTPLVQSNQTPTYEAPMTMEAIPVAVLKTSSSKRMTTYEETSMIVEKVPTPVQNNQTTSSKRTTLYETPMVVEANIVKDNISKKAKSKGRKAFAEVSAPVHVPADQSQDKLKDMTLDETKTPQVETVSSKTTRRGTTYTAEMNIESDTPRRSTVSKIPTPRKRKTVLGGFMDCGVSPSNNVQSKFTFPTKFSLTPSKIPLLVSSPARKKRLTTVDALRMDVSNIAAREPSVTLNENRKSILASTDMELSMMQCKSASPSFNLGHQARSTMYNLPIDIEERSNSPTVSQGLDVSSLDLFVNKPAPAPLPTKTIFSFKRPFAMIESPKVRRVSNSSNMNITLTTKEYTETAMQRYERQRKTMFEDDMIVEKAAKDSDNFIEKLESMNLSVDEELNTRAAEPVVESDEPSANDPAVIDVTIPVTSNKKSIDVSPEVETMNSSENMAADKSKRQSDYEEVDMDVTLTPSTDEPKQVPTGELKNVRDKTIIFPKSSEMETTVAQFIEQPSIATVSKTFIIEPQPKSTEHNHLMELTRQNEASETIESIRDASVFTNRPASLGFEMTKEAVKEQESLEKVILNLSNSIESSIYKTNSVGNLTFGNLSGGSNRESLPLDTSFNALDQIKSQLNVSTLISSINITPESSPTKSTPNQSQAQINDTCSCSIEISAVDVTVSRSRRTSLQNPEYERIRQRMLNNQPIFVFCKNCKCPESPAASIDVDDIEKEAERLLGLDELVLVEESKVTIEDLQREYDMKIEELNKPSPRDAYFPKNPGLKFLLQNLLNQALEIRDEKIQNDNEFARVPAPWPVTRDYAFLIKNKIESDNLPWMIRRSVHSPVGIMQYCHSRLRSVLLHVAIDKNSLYSDRPQPFIYREVEIIQNRLRPPMTPYAFAFLEEFKKQFPIGTSLLPKCETSNDLFPLLNYLDETIVGCENRVRQLFVILTENNAQPYITDHQLFAKKIMIFDEHKVILSIHLKLSNIENFSADCVVTDPSTAIPEKLRALNWTGLPLLEHLLVNVNSILFSS